MEYIDFSHEFVKEWYERAEEVDETKFLTKFFCYYIAFNHIFYTYAFEKGLLKTERGGTRKGERDMIKGLLEDLTGESGHESFKGYDPYSLIKHSELLKHVESERVKKKKRPNNHTKDKRTKGSIYQQRLNEKDIPQLFNEIYNIRCNLFHGSKSMKNSRNEGLVKDSNTALRDFLQRLAGLY